MQHLTREEFRTLLMDAKITDRQRLMFKVGFWHGLRVSELISLTAGVDVVNGFVIVQRLKGSMRTIQPFQAHPDPVLDEAGDLTALLKTLSAGELLFPMTRFGVYKLIQRAGRRVGLPDHKLHPHILKHSIAMQTIQIAGIENVRQHLGHKNISSTGAYLKVSDEQASRAISQAFV